MASRVDTCTEIPDKCKPLPLCPGCTILTALTVPCQKHTYWCWAAVTAAIYQLHNGSAIMQCEVASKQKGAGDCCKKPCGDHCNRRWFLERALCTVNCLDTGPISVSPTFSFSNLKVLFQSSAEGSPRPVCARLGWEGGGGHFVVIKGFQDASESLVIADPLDGEHLVPFNEFKDGCYKFGPWTDYYLTDKVNHDNCA
jgi:hypothetical protein